MVGLGLEIVGREAIERVVFVFPARNPFAIFIFEAGEEGGLILNLLGAGGIFEAGRDEGGEERPFDFFAAFHHGLGIVAKGFAEAFIEVAVGGAFDAIERSTLEEFNNIALNGAIDVIPFRILEILAGGGVNLAVATGDVFVEGESVVFARIIAGSLGTLGVFIEGAGGLEVDKLAVAAEENIIIFNIKHAEIGKCLRSVGAELDLTASESFVDDVLDEVGIATLIEHAETGDDGVDVLLGIAILSEVGETIIELLSGRERGEITHELSLDNLLLGGTGMRGVGADEVGVFDVALHSVEHTMIARERGGVDRAIVNGLLSVSLESSLGALVIADFVVVFDFFATGGFITEIVGGNDGFII